MAFLPGIFGRPQQQQQPQGPQQNPGVPSAQQSQQFAMGNQGQPQPNQNMNSNGSGGPAGSQQHGQSNGQMQPGGNPSNPLDPVLKLLTPSEDVVKQRQTRQQQESAPLFGDMTPEKITEGLGSVNFAQSVNPEMIQKALGGDQNAFMDVLNSVARSSASAAIQMSKGMVEHGVKSGTERVTGSLDSRIRDYSLRSKTSDNPALQHPFGKAMLQTISQQIAQANPQMSADDVSKAAQEALMTFGQQLTPQQQNQESNQGKQGTDWESLFLEQ